MKLNLKDSSNIKGATYVGTQLTVEFHNGSKYLYLGVTSDVIAKWVQAESVGKAFNLLIKKGEFQYQKLDTASEVLAG